MQDETNTPGSRREPPSGPARVLDRKVRAARLLILFERVWHALLWPFAVAGCFLLVSLAGAWSMMPPWAHQAGLIAFAIAGIASLAPLLRVPWPGREEALRRLERESGVAHRPASSYEDVLPESASAGQRELWTAHRQRLSELLDRLRAGLPRPRIGRADPYALRAALLLLLVIGFAVAGGSAWQRIGDALRVAPQLSEPNYRIDAWVTPPLYTDKPPVVLADGLQGETMRQLSAPERSQLLVRVNGPDGARPGVRAGAAGDTEPGRVEPASTEGAVTEYKIPITEPMTVEVGPAAQPAARWRFDVIKDQAPAVELTQEPSRTPRGALQFGFRVSDDYGVAHAEARFALPGESAETGKDGKSADKAPDGGDGGDMLSLEPPVIPLNLPRANAKTAESRTTRDLTAHPWAGMRVEMTLHARDQAGQTGRSQPYEMVLPQREFTKPLAKAIIEQRRKLVRSAGARETVAEALSALTIAPEHFSEDHVVYLGLRSAYWRLRHTKTEGSRASVVKQLWDLALRVEEGDLPQAEAELKAAQEELRRALEEGASEAEIERLMEQLRTALSNFLQKMAEQAQRDGNMAKMPEGLGEERMLSSKDLEEMLRNIENLAKTGSREMAQRMLNELSNMLQRLQTGRMAQQNSQSQRMMDMVQGLGDIISRQQKLLDETFKEQREREGAGRQGEGQEGGRSEQQRGEGGNGRLGERGEGQGQPRMGQGQGRYGALTKRQGEVRERLDELLEQLQGMGSRPPDQLEGAGRAMRDAEKALEGEKLGSATQQQTLALDRLRQGTQSVAEQVMQMLSSRMGRGNQGRKDPFGRPERTQGPDLGTSVEVPDEIDIQRAREILDELRRRLGEPARPMMELDYLERLIEQF